MTHQENVQTWYVYILECADGTLYTGCSNNVDKRLETHNSGKGAKYTRSRLPVRVVHRELFSTKSDALRREIEIKKLTREEKFRLCASLNNAV